MENDTNLEVLDEVTLELRKDPEDFGELKRLIGIAQTSNMQKQLNVTILVMTYKRIKEGKFYKRLGMTWENFCPAYLGKTRPIIDEMIDNLNTFGEEFLNCAQELRISRSMFRQFKALPAPEQETIKQMVIEGKADELEVFIEEKLAEKEREVQETRKSVETVLSENSRLNEYAEKAKAELEKANKTIADIEYTRTQLGNDEQAFAHFLKQLRIDGNAVQSRLSGVDMSRLDSGQLSAVYAVLLGIAEDIRELIQRFSEDYPHTFDLNRDDTEVEFGQMADKVNQVYPQE